MNGLFQMQQSASLSKQVQRGWSICGNIIPGVGKDEQRLREGECGMAEQQRHPGAPEAKEVRRGAGSGSWAEAIMWSTPDYTYSKCDKKPLEPRMTWADFPPKSNTLASLWRTDSKGAKVGERKTS